MLTTINTLDMSVYHDVPSEHNVTITEDALYPQMSPEEFVTAVTQRIDRDKSYFAKFGYAKRQARNADYWIGNQLDSGSLNDSQEKWVENAIFQNIETLIPIVNSRTPELISTPEYKNEETRSYASDIQRMLMTEWEVVQNMQPLLGRGIRNHQINYIAVYQMGYDPEDQECWTEEIVATDCVFSKDGRAFGRYIRNATIGDIIKRFPDKQSEVKRTLGFIPDVELPKSVLDSPTEYLEIWTDDMVGWKWRDTALGISKNPHFDRVGKEVEIPTGRTKIDEFGNQVPETVKQKVYFNHFKRPKMPFIFLTYWNRGIHLLDDTTLIEQGIGSQDWINKRKRQIGMNADSTNGTWVSSGDFISKEEFDKIEGGINERIWLENGLPAEGIQRVFGEQLPDYIYSDLLDSRNVLDNLMGTHATTRGARSGNNTATQDYMQKDQDYGRLDGYVRDGIEPFARHWFEYQYHLKLVYTLEDQSVAIPEDDDFEQENVIFSRDRVPVIQRKSGKIEPIKLIFKVKSGSTLPQDEVMRAAQAEKSKDVLAPMDYFKMIGVPNPRELTKNLLMWQMDPMSFFKDDPDIMEAMQKKQQQEAAAKQAAMQEAMAKEDRAATIEMQKQKMKMDGEMSKEKMRMQKMNADKMSVEETVEDDAGDDVGNGATTQGVANAVTAELQNVAGM